MTERVRALDAAGEDVNGTSLLKEVPLGYAQERGLWPVFDLLIELGADPRKIGFGSLHQAVHQGATDKVKRLLAATDDPLARTDTKQTPLAIAAEEGRAEIATLLLVEIARRGQIEDANVSDALALAVSLGHRDAARVFPEAGVEAAGALDQTLARYDRELLKLFVEYGTDLSTLTDLNLFHDDPICLRDADGAPAMLGGHRHAGVCRTGHLDAR